MGNDGFFEKVIHYTGRVKAKQNILPYLFHRFKTLFFFLRLVDGVRNFIFGSILI